MKTILKVILVGNTSCGKTSLMRRYVNEKFSTNYRATIGADFLSKHIDNNTTLQIWDTAGQERFRGLGSAFYRGSDACVIVFDVTVMDSFKAINKWYQDFINQSNIRDPNKFTFFLVGNKIDKKTQRTVDTEIIKSWTKEHPNFTYYETSAKKDINVKLMFEELTQKAIENKPDDPPYLPPTINLRNERRYLGMCCDR